MHIAVCDDNVADRKQIERLLKRESDKRTSVTGCFYTDSFGNATALLANPMQYDVFYVDICHTPGLTGADVANALAEKGVTAPIVMCCSEINYREQVFPENVIFLDKPIKPEEFSESIEHALHIKENAIPLIELREDKTTCYVRESDILYATKNGRLTDVFLTDDRVIHITISPANFFSQLEIYETIFAPDAKTVLNGRYIQALGFHKITMSDGRTFKAARGYMKYAKHIFEKFQNEGPA